MSMKEWAKREIELACKKERGNGDADEWDYGCACHESAYKAFLSLLDDGHSGMSIGFTRAILNRLIDGKPLTPIEDTPDIWKECVRPYTDEYKTYQCTRMSSLFKDIYPNGDVKYHDVDRMYCVDKDRTDSGGWHNGFIAKLIDEHYPITMPYMPYEKSMVVYCHDCLTDPANGDFDTLGVFYIIKPDGSKEEFNRFFKESKDGWTEIDEAEYMKRLEKSKEVTR